MALRRPTPAFRCVVCLEHFPCIRKYDPALNDICTLKCGVILTLQNENNELKATVNELKATMNELKEMVMELYYRKGGPNCDDALAQLTDVPKCLKKIGTHTVLMARPIG